MPTLRVWILTGDSA